MSRSYDPPQDHGNHQGSRSSANSSEFDEQGGEARAPRPCYTPLPAPHLPPPTDELIEIPSSPFGAIDTIKLVSRHPCQQEDLDALLASGEWSRGEREGGTETTRKGATRRVGRFSRLQRKRDDCRVRLFERRIEVEVSVPRVLGLKSDEHHLMTEADVLRALDMVTSSLFPATTRKARMLTPDDTWHVTRLDIAVNFPGSIRDVVEAYRHARRPRSPAQGEVYAKGELAYITTGISWYGSDFDLLIYDPAERARRGKQKSLRRGQKTSPANRERVRFEFRFKTPKALLRLLAHFEASDSGLPFFVPCSDGTSRVRRFWLDHHRLHRVLATEMYLLGHGGVVLADTATAKGQLRHFALLHLAAHPESLAEVQRTSRRTFRQVEQELTQVKVQTKDVDLVQLAYPGPRISALLRQRFFRQARVSRLRVGRELSPLFGSGRLLPALVTGSSKR